MRSFVFAVALIATFVSSVALAQEAAGNATNDANAFIESQYTVYHYGEQVPHWQIFAGLNFQF